MRDREQEGTTRLRAHGVANTGPAEEDVAGPEVVFPVPGREVYTAPERLKGERTVRPMFGDFPSRGDRHEDDPQLTTLQKRPRGPAAALERVTIFGPVTLFLQIEQERVSGQRPLQ
jgi:hypothetical protein